MTGLALAAWIMIQACDGDKQADAHLLTMGSQNILIDTGRSGDLVVPALKAKGVKELHQVIISHPHNDHYGGLIDLLTAGIRIDEVYLNQPQKDTCAHESWGCSGKQLEKIAGELSRRKIPVKTLRPGQLIHAAKDVKLEVLYAYDGLHTPVGKTDINDMSAILLLTAGKTKVLFTGDLNAPLGEYLAKHGKNLQADLLKVPHHGTEGVAPDSFFDKVGAKVALVPAPESLWKSDRSKRVRDYFEKHHVPTFVSGIDGNVTVTIDDAGYQITNSSGKVLHSPH